MTRYQGEHEYQYKPTNSAITRGSGCSWVSGATGADYATGGRIDPTPDQVHRKVKPEDETNPQTPGWSLIDLRNAMRALGVPFEDRTGKGWAAVKAARKAGLYIVLQGDSDRFPDGCSGKFDGNHAIGIPPDDTNAKGEWAIDDPICPSKTYEPEATLRAYAEKLSRGVWFGVFTTPVPVLLPDTDTGEAMDSFSIPEVPSVLTVKAGATLYTTSALKADPKNVTVRANYTVRYIGKVGSVLIVGHDRSPDITGKSALFVRASDTTGITPAIPATATR